MSKSSDPFSSAAPTGPTDSKARQPLLAVGNECEEGQNDLDHLSQRTSSPEAEDRLNDFKTISQGQQLLTYLLFFTLGSSFLLPWNSLLVSTTYFGSRLRGNPFELTYMNWITVVFTLANVVFLYRATFSPASNSLTTIRIFGSLCLFTFLAITLLISTIYTTLDSNLFFAFILLVTLSEAFGSAYLQTSVIGLSSWFGSKYLQAIFSGQGGIAALVSVLQLLANIKEVTSSDGPSSPEDNAKHIRMGSFNFYIACTAFCLFALISFAVLLKLPIYEIAMQRKHQSAKSCDSDDPSIETPLLSSVDPLTDGLSFPIPVPAGPQIRLVEPKIRLLGLSIFYNYFITLAVFPSLTGSVLSSNDPDHTHIISLLPSTQNGLLQNWYKPSIFIPIHFVVFNFGDWLGKALPQILTKFSEGLVKKKRVLYTISIMRTFFIPLLLVCNVDHSGIVIFKSDLIYLLILTLFAITNGYLSTIVMVAGVLEPSLEPNEVGMAATCLSFYLTLGLAAGSLISFGMKAIVLKS